ncbi:MAG TPA: gluconate 2-dehydrogenase subunit 3 family protein [Verrucomicrobiae bacterium]|nr:gluconate 2-dehydrogenase subunit 3 family protein [Verrucomicrobiae bacterium]
MSESQQMDRRTAIKWMMAASATISMLEVQGFGSSLNAAQGYGSDPDLLKTYEPGDLWPLTFTETQRRIAAALCNTIIPADEKSPAANEVGVTNFIDEWISAPYPRQQKDRNIILKGLTWLNDESLKRFKKDFADLSEVQQGGICEDICCETKAKPEFKEAANFFNRFRNLTVGGFYTTSQGWKDLQYIGNVALSQFDGPPREVLVHLKLI